MRQDGVWGTAIEILAFTIKYKKIQIIIHQYDPRASFNVFLSR